MKNLKRDNEGFSLVELIVVVLIMAIIAVALAPQVLKWVNNARISSDLNTEQTIISDAQTALTNEKAYGEIKTTSADASTTERVTITINNSNTTIEAVSGVSSIANFIDKFKEYSGASSTGDTATKMVTTDFKTKENGAVIVIAIYGNGRVAEKSNSGSGSTGIDN